MLLFPILTKLSLSEGRITQSGTASTKTNIVPVAQSYRAYDFERIRLSGLPASYMSARKSAPRSQSAALPSMSMPDGLT